MLNQITLIGRLGAAPEIRQVGGNTVANLRLATSEKWTDKATGERQERTEWHSVELWGRKAEIAGQYLDKGSLIYVQGKLHYKTRETDDGESRTYTTVRGDNFQMLGGNQND